jgi:hypothetical protein
VILNAVALADAAVPVHGPSVGRYDHELRLAYVVGRLSAMLVRRQTLPETPIRHPDDEHHGGASSSPSVPQRTLGMLLMTSCRDAHG